MTSMDRNPGTCPCCGEEAAFSHEPDETVTARAEVPDNATEIWGCYDPENYDRYYWHFATPDETETWTVPVIDPYTGDGWDEEVEAASAQEAVEQIDDDWMVAKKFAAEHFGFDGAETDEDEGDEDDPPPEDFDYGDKRPDGQYENYPTTDEGEFVQEPRSTYTHADGCGSRTSMTDALAESVARDPTFYTKTFCSGCGEHVPVGEVEWTDGEDWVVDQEDGDGE